MAGDPGRPRRDTLGSVGWPVNVEEVPLSALHEHKQNARQGDVGSVVESIKAMGWWGTIVANKDGTVLAGNHRLKAARELGMESLPVYWVDVDDETALRILLADNRTSDLASWDNAALAGLLVDLQQQTETGLTGLGWDTADLDALIAEVAKTNGYSGVDPGPGERYLSPWCRTFGRRAVKWDRPRNRLLRPLWRLSHRLSCRECRLRRRPQERPLLWPYEFSVRRVEVNADQRVVFGESLGVVNGGPEDQTIELEEYEDRPNERAS